MAAEPTLSIPFPKPRMTGRELAYTAQAHAAGHLAGDGMFLRRGGTWLEQGTGTREALLTHACTAARGMAAMLAGIGPGDEAIMTSYTFVSTANAFVLRGGVPVFVNIQPDALNIDEYKIEAAIAPRAKAIMPAHCAGVGCEMDTIMGISYRHNLPVIEDAAQGVLSRYRGRPLGSIGHLGALPFHETKNNISGKVGALLVENDARFIDRAEVSRETSTDRSRFVRGQVDHCTRIDLGSAYLPGEFVAALLWAQTEEAQAMIDRRLELWAQYHRALEAQQRAGALLRPGVPADCPHNAHRYCRLLPGLAPHTEFIGRRRSAGIDGVSYDVPLHSAPAGQSHGPAQGTLDVTGLPETRQADVIDTLTSALQEIIR